MTDKQTRKILEEMLLIHGVIIAIKEANPDIEINIPDNIKGIISTLEDCVKIYEGRRR